ncbi:hypothetical protein P170DRAFT_499431 [Aspergillus steynii IBT 23096]|uniref:Uncharacterized protein n=1 Tax=Aspergillus steynii IBT 23096 TaxID=1392250 RepID=A0A2I2G2W1_9EURO|nr:uncharacterized protein P170DRAFT_499431 [Aspergillus steynii IBT 23096]PLB47212.1 hypothetical protein P170DRAFT_499431 [Aspergillus steynii IBT 23096]
MPSFTDKINNIIPKALTVFNKVFGAFPNCTTEKAEDTMASSAMAEFTFARMTRFEFDYLPPDSVDEAEDEFDERLLGATLCESKAEFEGLDYQDCFSFPWDEAVAELNREVERIDREEFVFVEEADLKGYEPYDYGSDSDEEFYDCVTDLYEADPVSADAEDDGFVVVQATSAENLPPPPVHEIDWDSNWDLLDEVVKVLNSSPEIENGPVDPDSDDDWETVEDEEVEVDLEDWYHSASDAEGSSDGPNNDDGWDLLGDGEIPQKIEEVEEDWDSSSTEAGDVDGPENDDGWDHLGDEEIPQETNGAGKGNGMSPPAAADSEDGNESDFAFAVDSVELVERQRDELEESTPSASTSNESGMGFVLVRQPEGVDLEGDEEERGEEENEERLKDLLSPSTFDWMDETEDWEEGEEEKEERLKELLRPSAFDWMDEAEDDESAVVGGSEDDFPRGRLYNFMPPDEDVPMNIGLMQTDLSVHVDTPAAPSSGLILTDGTECYVEGALDDGYTTDETLTEQDGPLVHHYNWYGAPVFVQSSTPPEVSLLVSAVGPKISDPHEECRLYSIINRACLYVDPVIVMLDEGDELQTEFESVMELVRYATGRTFKFYSPYGAWVGDSLDDKVAVDQQRYDVDTCERNIVSNERLGCGMTCRPTSSLERKLRARREAARARAESKRPSPLRQVMTNEDLHSKGETVTMSTPLSTAVLTCDARDEAAMKLLPAAVAEESMQGGSVGYESILEFNPAAQDSQLDFEHNPSSLFDSDSDLEEIERSDELKDIDMEGKKPEGKVLESQKSGLIPDSDFEEQWSNILKKSSQPNDLCLFALIESLKSDFSSMRWVKDFTLSGPDPDWKVEGLGHNPADGFVPFVDVTVFPVLLGLELEYAPERQWVELNVEDDSSLYSRDIDERRYSYELESNISDSERLPSIDLRRAVSEYRSIVAREHEAASFYDDARIISNWELPPIPNPFPSLQPFYSLYWPAVVPLPLSPLRRPRALKKRTPKPRANIKRHMTLRRRLDPLRTPRPVRQSLSTMAHKSRRFPRKRSSPKVPAAAHESDLSASDAQCRFPAVYDSFDELGVEPPRRQSKPLALLVKCVLKVRNGTRALLEKTKKGLAPNREDAPEGGEERVRRKLQKRRK